MSNKEVLEKAIAKAIDNGWKAPRGNRYGVADDGTVFAYVKDSEIRAYGVETSLRELIFNHDFAKALWGEEYKDWPLYKIKDFEFHLQQMVVADDPVQYLGDNL